MLSFDRRPTVPEQRVGPGEGDAPRGVLELPLASLERRLGVVLSGAGGDGALLCVNGVKGGTGGKVPGVEGTDDSGEVFG